MKFLFLCFGAIFFSLAATPVLIARARQWGLMDLPGERKIHHKPMPLAGGPVFFPLMVAAYLIAFPKNQALSFLLAATAIIFALGIWDDLKGVHFSTKFFAQITAALLVMQGGVGFDLNRISLLEGLGFHFGQLLSTVVTLLWIVGITNAVNLIDGMDGLACGLCLNAFVGLGAIALVGGSAKGNLALFCIMMAGGLLGFLRYNIDPARTFLGDSGSMLLGFTLAVVSILQSGKTNTFLVLVIPVLLLGIPMTDTTLAFLRRASRGQNPFKADRWHLHHKLLDLNFSVKQTLGLFYSLSAALGVLALWLVQTGNGQIVALALLVMIAAVMTVKAMQIFNFRALIQRGNQRMRAVARQAVSRERSGEERFVRNLAVLAVLCVLNLVLLTQAGRFAGLFLIGVIGLFGLGFLDFFLNSREEEPRFEIMHTVVFLSLVLNQIIVLVVWPRYFIQVPSLALSGFLTITVLGWFLIRTGTFAAFLQDPMEVLNLFIALVAVGLAKYYLDAPHLLPFAVAVVNAIILYTLTKVYLTGYWVRSRVVTAGLAAFALAMAGMACI